MALVHRGGEDVRVVARALGWVDDVDGSLPAATGSVRLGFRV